MKNHSFPALLTALFLAVAGLARAEDSAQSIALVCEHGAVKSLMAASFFNRLATGQKLDCPAAALTKQETDRAAAVVAQLKPHK